MRIKECKIWNQMRLEVFLTVEDYTSTLKNDLGPVYGHQWQHNAEYKDCDTDYTGKRVDQLQYY